jgi:hypothetical protein
MLFRTAPCMQLLELLLTSQVYTWPGGGIVSGFGWNAAGAYQLFLTVSFPECWASSSLECHGAADRKRALAVP